MDTTQPRAPVLAPLFAAVRPLVRFFQLEAASGILLLLASAAALGLANSPLAGLYHAVFDYQLALGWNGRVFGFTLHHLINDGLMTVFFFVVGMEIKRELVAGELRTARRALLPAVAALGGMAAPALIYLAFNRGGPGARGWAIPTATDIAFAVGCLTLLKGRVPPSLVVFVTALAIFDDLGGIAVIAAFYGHGFAPGWLLGAAALALALWAAGRAGLRSNLLWGLGGLGLWYLVGRAGVHATLSGVALGLLIPLRSRRPAREVLADLERHARELRARPEVEAPGGEELVEIADRIDDLVPPLPRLVHALHPLVAFGIMPLFALANAGVHVTLDPALLREPVVLGSALGLLVGKQLGIFAATWASVKVGLSPLPEGASLGQTYGVSVLAGIGFTVALFVAGLAFADAPALLDQAKLGILSGSLLSGLAGLLLLRLLGRKAKL